MTPMNMLAAKKVVSGGSAYLTIASSRYPVTQSPTGTFKTTTSSNTQNWLLFNETIASGQDFRLVYQQSGDLGAYSAMGIDTDNTLEVVGAGWATYIYYKVVASGANFGTPTGEWSATSVNDLLSIKRVGSVHTAELSQTGGASWIGMTTLSNTHTGLYYIKGQIEVVSGQIVNPQLILL